MKPTNTLRGKNIGLLDIEVGDKRKLSLSCEEFNLLNYFLVQSIWIFC